ncbi:MAG: hypothetical protein CSA84_07305 [Actinomycetales bacterium]|nr:MAG: hypothetical protein CSA84_07305 [Actinomycetales bacterium]
MSLLSGGRGRLGRLARGTVTACLLASAGCSAADADRETSGAGAAVPAGVLDLSPWKLALPEPADDGHSVELAGPQLQEFSSPSFRLDAAGDTVLFTVPVGGFVQAGSQFARTELRELNPDGSRAAWSAANGRHVLAVEGAILAVPPVHPSIVAAQIHGTDEYIALIRLDRGRLYVKTNDSITGETLDPDYRLGRRYRLRILVEQDEAVVNYAALTGEGNEPPIQSTVRLPVSCRRCYFKVGAYLQTNQTLGDDASSQGTVAVSSLRVKHEEAANSVATSSPSR